MVVVPTRVGVNRRIVKISFIWVRCPHARGGEPVDRPGSSVPIRCPHARGGGGFDPVTYIKKYPGRTLTMHMKDSSAEKKSLLIGEGDMKWQELFDAAESVGGVEWYLVEQETYPFPPLESVEKSLANLRKLLAQRKGQTGIKWNRPEGISSAPREPPWCSIN